MSKYCRSQWCVCCILGRDPSTVYEYIAYKNAFRTVRCSGHPWGGVLSAREVSVCRGCLSARGGCLPAGECLPTKGGVSTRGVSACQTPSVDRMTDV